MSSVNPFDEARKIEKEGMKYLVPFLRYHSYNGQLVVIDKGPLARFLQETIGDLLFNEKRDKTLLSVEVKCEQSNKWDNFFLEEWSNGKRDKPGWMRNGLKADLLWYFFIKEQDLYVISLEALRCWAYTNNRIEDYQLKEQHKYTQRNDTWGRCVPIETIRTEVGFKKFFLNHGQLTLAL
jgi:hypothetical protein